MMNKNIFIVGLDDFNRSLLERTPHASEYSFHGLLEPEEVYDTYDFPIADMVRRSIEQIREFQRTSGQSVDAICGYHDFPVSTMLPLICREFATRSPSLESLMKCEHKYWSRLEQEKVVPEHIPQFYAFDPFNDRALEEIPLEFPYWIKPIKSSGSFLGFRIRNAEDFRAAMPIIRDQIGLISDPFGYVMGQIELPPEVASVQAHYCIAEGLIGGRQCTLEGYALHGRIECTGIVDSIRYENGVSFFRYEYPSTLPFKIQERMIRITEKVISHIGFDDSAFNIEYYWDRGRDKIWLLEINTRVSQSHSDIFEKVDGASNQALSVDVALGRDPEFPYQRGEFPRAAKFFWRVFENGIVRAVPSQHEIEQVQREVPGAIILPQVWPAVRLDELLEQDSYSYAICYLYIGGEDQKDLLDKYLHCQDILTFEIEPLAGEANAPADPSTTGPTTPPAGRHRGSQ
ncbi:MAG: ATP-grasp domain-containing protein [Spirochaetota bacterium]